MYLFLKDCFKTNFYVIHVFGDDSLIWGWTVFGHLNNPDSLYAK